MFRQEERRKILLAIEELRKEDLLFVGGKNANLGELASIGIPIPSGVAVTTYAYEKFIEETGLKEKIEEILSGIRNKSPEKYENASKKIQQLIMSTDIPDYIEDEIRRAYQELTRKIGREVKVAIRSSATAEDLPDASFAGQQDTYLNVIGEDSIIEHVKKCWASLFTPRAIAYRESKGIDHSSVLISVAIQRMINSRSSGVMFTINPVTGEDDKIVIEGSWGLGEAIVQGKVTPDKFVINKATGKIIERRINEKRRAILFDSTSLKNVEIELPRKKEEILELEEKGNPLAGVIRRFNMLALNPSLSEDEIKKLAEYAMKIEEHYGKAMDIEWAIDQDLKFPEGVFIVQARPETIWNSGIGRRRGVGSESELGESSGKVLLRGLAASPGIAVGTARVILSTDEAKESMKVGDILVTKMTDPDWVPYMKLASAIITDEGGMTAHAAIVSRELGIPCIVGTKEATTILKDGMTITVDATHGAVYEGTKEDLLKEKKSNLKEDKAVGMLGDYLSQIFPITATKIYMNLGMPSLIEKYADLPFDGIGLMRVEFIFAEEIKFHPLYLLERGQEKVFIDKMADGIAKVARAIYPRPVVVRFSDFKTNEYRKLVGGEKYELEERNPMLGWRGASRYVSSQYEAAFKLELRAIRKAREEYGLKNIWVMVPFVRTTWELKKVLRIMEEEGLERSRDFKVWIMAEVPSVIFLADEFSQMVDGFSIGSNDLTQLTLGADRDSDILGSLGYFDERDEAVKRAISHLIETAHKHGVTVSICGQAPSVYPEFTDFLVREGIDSISVNPDVVISTRRIVASIERKLILDSARKLS